MTVTTDPTAGIPRSAWRRRLDQTRTPLTGSPVRVTPRLVLTMFPVLVRLGAHMLRARLFGRETVLFRPGRRAEPVMGVPIGGLGGGSITRGWRGHFTRWQLRPGFPEYRTVPVDQFSLWVRRDGQSPRALVLAPRPEPLPRSLAGWSWDLEPSKATYHALFPRAWTVYEDPLPELTLVCRQISPVIPHNYVEASYPVGVFVWTVRNTGPTAADVSLMLSFQNGTGGPGDTHGGHTNHPTRAFAADGGDDIVGVELRHADRRRGRPAGPGAPGPLYEDPLSFAIAVRAGRGVEATRRTRLSLRGGGAADLWRDFAADGRLDDEGPDPRHPVPSAGGEAIGAAVAARVRIPPGETRELVFSLAWDMPLARFDSGTAWYRRYTRFYGREGLAAPLIARDAIVKHPAWEAAIEAWQKPVLDDPALPDWYKSTLFNETYYLVDGGTVWTAGLADPGTPPGGRAGGRPDRGFLPECVIGHFAYLESHEYLMYNTYDVHFSASFALASLWPRLELSLQRDFARSLNVEHPETVSFLHSGVRAPRKVKGVVPHDLGSPLEDPWRRLNAYNAQDVSRWKDLNPKFVLTVYRDYVLTGDRAFLAEVWEAVQAAVSYLYRFDRDGDGLIENEGFPDQTYDVWSASGPSAYSGGLWLACLSAAAAIASELGREDRVTEYQALLARAEGAYDKKLWNGEYYDYDASGSPHHDSVMADQLAGHWFARACGLPGVVPPEKARSALLKVYDLNVRGLAGGERGALNGVRPDGRPDRTCMQSAEVWTGTTFSLAAALLQEGLDEEAFATARGVYLSVYRDYPLWFQTPEAIDVDGVYRATGYMRPLAVWAMQWELERRRVARQGRGSGHAAAGSGVDLGQRAARPGRGKL